MVTQDTSLLHRSVRDNILYGRPDADEAMMVEAARRAEALDFIAGLADPKGRKGLDAHVGERGVKLSGGQRQRIAIARVMLKDAPILILDEATSALDSEVEAAIQENLYRLMEGKTVIAIAHRLSTIAAMDRLVVMDDGRIIEEGTHDELVAKGGLYAQLWERQSGGFLLDTKRRRPGSRNKPPNECIGALRGVRQRCGAFVVTRGVRLSGCHRQRVAIARVFLAGRAYIGARQQLPRRSIAMPRRRSRVIATRSCKARPSSPSPSAVDHARSSGRRCRR